MWTVLVTHFYTPKNESLKEAREITSHWKEKMWGMNEDMNSR